ncbi:AAA family ATPase [[Mycoplasma] testudinis]|uniref:AAA family ATPase n=1 Tax=[Mycoplasma] testudinis TaxID=33924 RepID=UPI0004814CE8|nr:AAA family ATPase [[Mycoplasma] testudinis]
MDNKETQALTNDKQLEIINEYIEYQFSLINSNVTKKMKERVSQQIAIVLRHLVNHIIAKVVRKLEKNDDIDEYISYKELEDSLGYLKSHCPRDAKPKYFFLIDFYEKFKYSVSHYLPSPEACQKLMWDYIKFLYEIKELMRKDFNEEYFSNITNFILEYDPMVLEHYNKISDLLMEKNVNEIVEDKFYVIKSAPKFTKNGRIFEVTLSPVEDCENKFRRITAYTLLKLNTNYALDLQILTKYFELNGRSIKAELIVGWNFGIRMCEIINFNYIFHEEKRYYSENELLSICKYMKHKNCDLVYFLDCSDDAFDSFCEEIKKDIEPESKIFFYDVLKKVRVFCKEKRKGWKILRYLLYSFRLKTIRPQLSRYNKCIKIEHKANNLLSDLRIGNSSIPFEDHPLNFDLQNLKLKRSDVLDCFWGTDVAKNQEEVFASFIKEKTVYSGKLFLDVQKNWKEIEDCLPVDEKNIEGMKSLLDKYNKSLYTKFQDAQIKYDYGQLYLSGYLKSTKTILESIMKLFNGICQTNLQNENFSFWYKKENPKLKNQKNIDAEKISGITKMLSQGCVVPIYGPAGTGKSFTMNVLANFFNKERKLFLTITNSARNNLRNVMDSKNSNLTKFTTVEKAINKASKVENVYDVLFLDESSTISNDAMLEILEKFTRIRFLVLAGDIFQLESIEFGNWFKLLDKFLPNEKKLLLVSHTELTKNHN